MNQSPKDCACGHSTIMHAYERPDGESFARPTKCLHPGCKCSNFNVKVDMENQVIREVILEITESEATLQKWPGDPFVGLCKLDELMGDLSKAITEVHLNKGKKEDVQRCARILSAASTTSGLKCLSMFWSPAERENAAWMTSILMSRVDP